MRWMPLLALTLLLAGCSSPGTAPGGSGPGAPAAGEVRFAGCEQVHTFYPSPPAGFVARLPPGFSLAYQDPAQQTVQVVVFGNACQGGKADLLAAVQVVPPPQYRNGSLAVDALVLQAFTTDPAEHALLAGAGPLAILGTVSQSVLGDSPGGRLERVDASGGGLSYTLTTQVVLQSSAFGAATYRYWLANGTTVSGYLESGNGGGTSLGQGSAALLISGDPTAPPLSPGIAHRASGIAVAQRLVPVILK
jgi:hypothetical protein